MHRCGMLNTLPTYPVSLDSWVFIYTLLLLFISDIFDLIFFIILFKLRV